MKAVLLLSRQPLHPSRSSAWVEAAVKALTWIKENGGTVLGSCGTPTWDLVTAAAIICKVDVRVIVPASSPDDFDNKRMSCSRQFGILPGSIIPYYHDNSLSKKEICELRDRHIVNESDTLIRISIRKKGLMDTLAAQHSLKAAIISSFETPYAHRIVPIHYHIDTEGVPKETIQLKNQFIIHWTRSSTGPWPGERLYDYYNAVLNSPTYPRTAFHSLQNILRVRKIFASSSHMPGNVSVVSFSASSPVDFIPLMRWRSRYRQMSFEPYGIGIEREYALATGMRRVTYTKKKSNDGNGRWLVQSAGVKGNWEPEKEYRYKGDYDLSRTPGDKLAAFCLYKHEADSLTREFGISCFNFTGSASG